MYPLDDTIAAIASPPGGAARGIVRLSGPRAIECVEAFFHAEDGQSSTPRAYPSATAGSLALPGLHAPLPCEVYWWRSDGGTARVRSYTGQPVAEIHTLGSPPLLQRLLHSLCDAGARAAGPGEFTLRAFLAGRMDLTQAEAVLGVIDAVDHRTLDVALGQLAGGLARPLDRLRDELLDLLAELEAGLDFADEELPFLDRDELDRRLAAADRQVLAMLDQMAARGDAVHHATAVLVGRPNTGKSSLFNAMAGGAAIVSDQPGATRDYLAAELDLDGVRCRLVDTAGAIEERNETKTPRDCGPGGNSANDEPPTESIDSSAQAATIEQRRAAQLEILCLDATRPLDDWERAELESPNVARLVTWTKCDAIRPAAAAVDAIATSSRTGEGLDVLKRALRRQLADVGGASLEVVAGTAARCRQSLQTAARSLCLARESARIGREELVAADLRAALVELGKIVGAVYTDDVLDRIFSRFCIGK